jgi:fatty acid desaturase
MNMVATSNTLTRFSQFNLRSQSSDVVFSLKLIVYGALITFGIHLALSESLILTGIGIVMLGVTFTHGVELQHQVLHSQGFKNSTLNEAVGIALGLPMFVSYANYQWSHLRHHKYLGTPENKEFFDYGDQYGVLTLRSLGLLVLRLFMLKHYWGLLKGLLIAISLRPFKDVPTNISKRMTRDYLLMGCGLISLVVVSGVYGADFVLRIWFLPLLLVATPIHALIEMPEHFRCDTSSMDIFSNTRTIKSNAFMNWFTNGNNYHVEHHLMPGLPIDRLHDLHAEISSQCKYLNISYREFYLDLIRSATRHG